MKQKMFKYILLLTVLSLLFFDIIYAEEKSSPDSIIELDLSFADKNWDGKIIPKGQQCQEYGGNGASPRIKVKNIPNQANKLVLEFSDGTYLPCDNGGHGIISYKIPHSCPKTVLVKID